LSQLVRQEHKFDVVVVGGTPGGISAAVSAARLGCRVALVEYHVHVGGMATSGLGKSDIENRYAMSELFEQFVSRVHEHYLAVYGRDSESVRLCHEGYYYETSVAEAVLVQILSEFRLIRVLKGQQLETTSIRGNVACGVVVANRETKNSDDLPGKS